MDQALILPILLGITLLPFPIYLRFSPQLSLNTVMILSSFAPQDLHE